MRIVVAARLSRLHNGETGLDDQETEAIRWAEHHGHEVVGIAADHQTGKSALWERPQLRPWVLEPAKLMGYDALVALKVDRLTRADDEGVDALKAWARKERKQILITSAEVHFPSEGVEGLLWDAYIRMAHQEWLAIKDRYARMQAGRHEAGSVVGPPPWGYEVIKAGDIKILEPTPEGRIWVPQIFTWLSEGKSAPEVGRLLESAGVKSKAPNGRWHESRIVGMARNATYSGLRKRKGRAALPVDELVSRALQEKAVAEIESRARLGASATVRPKALLANLNCGHPDCPAEGKSPMYRIKEYYRCSGAGPRRRGCGAPMVRVDVTDHMVLTFSAHWDANEHVSQVFVAGNDTGARLELLRAEMADAMRRTDASELATVAAGYATRIAALEAEGSVQPHWEDARTGETEGQHLASLDLDGQRAYLARKDIRAWKDTEGRTCVTVDGALARTGGPSIIADI